MEREGSARKKRGGFIQGEMGGDKGRFENTGYG